jgi:hypothetical protein
VKTTLKASSSLLGNSRESATWLRGVKIEPGTSEAMRIQLRGFHGDLIDARVWMPRLGHPVSMRSIADPDRATEF